MDSMKKFSAMLYYLFMPIYSFMEISHVTSIESIKEYWILIVSTGSSISTGFFLARIFHYAFSLEERISESFSITLAFPAIGSFPLVISKFMCFPGRPLEGEKLSKCNRDYDSKFDNIYVFCICYWNFFSKEG
jgi:predicted permease